MSETKFTPGPWFVWDDSNQRLEIGPSRNYSVASMWVTPLEGQQANAHLIAAAPDLYEVVEKLAKWNKDYPSTRVYGYGDIKQIAEEMDAINAKAIAALAKTRGEA
jgi:hypothetical protein